MYIVPPVFWKCTILSFYAKVGRLWEYNKTLIRKRFCMIGENKIGLIRILVVIV